MWNSIWIKIWTNSLNQSYSYIILNTLNLTQVKSMVWIQPGVVWPCVCQESSSSSSCSCLRDWELQIQFCLLNHWPTGHLGSSSGGDSIIVNTQQWRGSGGLQGDYIILTFCRSFITSSGMVWSWSVQESGLELMMIIRQDVSEMTGDNEHG